MSYEEENALKAPVYNSPTQDAPVDTNFDANWCVCGANETTQAIKSEFRKRIDSVTAYSEGDPDVGLKPRIGLFGGVMVIVGCIIGSGIFVSPKGVHENTNSVGFALIVWVVCGVFSAIGAYCYAELGTFITKSGGDYAYVCVAFGPFVGFLRMWIECIIVRPCTMTVVAMTFAIYIIRPFYPHCDPPPMAPPLLAAGCLILLTLVNALSVRAVTTVQNVFTVAKLLALFLIIATGVVLLIIGNPYLDSFDNIMENSDWRAGKIALAFYSGLWAYNGWNYLNFVTEELENPTRNLPLAICISMVLCTTVYVLTNVAFYAGVSPDEMLESSAVAVTFADRFYSSVHLAWIMPVFVGMSCFGTVNGVLLTSSRLFFVAGRENHMPWVLSMINPNLETPIPSVLFCGVLSLLYLLLSDNIYSLINYVQIVNWLAIGVATAGLIYMRYTLPPKDHHRPLKVNIIFPIIFLLGCVFLVIFPMYQAFMDTMIGLGIMMSGVPVYLIFVHWKSKPAAFNNLIDSMTLTCQKLLLVVPGEKKQLDADD